jgi:hypothetical protein
MAVTLAAGLAIGAMPALAQTSEIDAQGAALVDEFIEILKQPDEEKRAGLSEFLAEEFQIVRSSGARMDQGGYLDDQATVFEVSISDVHATEADGVLVVSYLLSVDELLDGVEIKTAAPRLSVFRLGDDGEWRISAHANFGALEDAASDDG